MITTSEYDSEQTQKSKHKKRILERFPNFNNFIISKDFNLLAALIAMILVLILVCVMMLNWLVPQQCVCQNVVV